MWSWSTAWNEPPPLFSAVTSLRTFWSSSAGANVKSMPSVAALRVRSGVWL
jgi:hypothetical protein